VKAMVSPSFCWINRKLQASRLVRNKSTSADFRPERPEIYQPRATPWEQMEKTILALKGRHKMMLLSDLCRPFRAQG
ncbi:MAG: hypothetical protein QF437_30335, partial [Planctomycetota bacterium]|nr:hypothetical protein [Planctomycetota bacterium]